MFADSHGNVIHLGERDCSLQRRHQKVIEEAPAPGMTPELRAQMGAAAVEAARAVGYVGAGTVEFIADGTKGLRADAFWFIEMNTRLQVEHPVTEAVTGARSGRVAIPRRLPAKSCRSTQSQIRIDGHAIEARVYAEDPENGFLPSTGRIVALELPADIRVDSGVEAGGEVTPYYDAMIAKLIAHAPTREAALDRLAAALDRTVIAGPRSNVAFLAALCRARASSARARSIPGSSTATSRRLARYRTRPTSPPRRSASRICSCITSATNCRTTMRRLMRQPKPVRHGRRATAFNSAARARTPCRSSIDGESAAATVSYGKDGMRVAIEGAAPATDARVFAAGDEAYVLRHGRQTRVRIKDFAAAAAAGRRRRRRHQGADAWQGAGSSSSRSAIASPPANVLP